MKYIVKRSGVNGNRTISARHSGIEIAYASVNPAARSIDDETRRLRRCRTKPPRPQPSRATDTMTNVKWYQIVAE